MKRQFLILTLSFLPVQLFAQGEIPSETTQKQYVGTLKYEPTYSTEDSYLVLKNDSNAPIPDEINLQMNLHRKFDEQVVWEVNEKLTILLYPFK